MISGTKVRVTQGFKQGRVGIYKGGERDPEPREFAIPGVKLVTVELDGVDRCVRKDWIEEVKEEPCASS